MRHTTNPGWLNEPRESAIQRVARREGMEPLNAGELDFVRDMICRSAGIDVDPIDEQRVHHMANHRAEEIVREWYGRITGLWRDVEYERTGFIERYREQHELIRVFPLESVPGYNSLQSAVRLVQLVRLIERAREVGYWYAGSGMELFFIIQGAQALMANLQSQLLPFLLPFVDDDQPEAAAVHLGLQFAVRHIELAEMLRIARQLQEVSELDSPRAMLREDLNGEDVLIRGIEQLGELPRASQQVFALPTRLMMYHAVAGNLAVREPATRRDKRQLIYMIVDATGSMQGLPIGRAAGVVLNRLEAVIKGDAELYLRFFDTDLGETEYHANSIESARQLMEVITDPNTYSGGSTNFVRPLTDASTRVHALVSSGALRDPELVMVTDGDAVVPGPSVLSGVKLHTIQVGDAPVLPLAELARSTGGINIDATGNTVEVR